MATADEEFDDARGGGHRHGRGDGVHTGSIQSGSIFGKNKVRTKTEVGKQEEEKDGDLQAGDSASDRTTLGTDGAYTTHKYGRSG